jgi:hypothetical protein
VWLIAVSNGVGNIRRVEAALKPPAGFASTCAQVAGIETGPESQAVSLDFNKTGYKYLIYLSIFIFHNIPYANLMWAGRAYYGRRFLIATRLFWGCGDRNNTAALQRYSVPSDGRLET